MAQLSEWLLPILEVRGPNAVISKNLILIFFLLTGEKKKKSPGMALFSKLNTSFEVVIVVMWKYLLAVGNRCFNIGKHYKACLINIATNVTCYLCSGIFHLMVLLWIHNYRKICILREKIYTHCCGLFFGKKPREFLSLCFLRMLLLVVSHTLFFLDKKNKSIWNN